MGFFMVPYLPSDKSNEVTNETKGGIFCVGTGLRACPRDKKTQPEKNLNILMNERGLSETASCAITVRA